MVNSRPNRGMSLSEIMDNLDPDFFKDSDGYKHKSKVMKVLQLMVEDKPYPEQVEAAVDCLYEFWRHYSSEHMAKILKDFAKVQMGLFGFELEEEIGRRYRDHFLHMFNVFTFGSIILSLTLHKDPAKKDSVLEQLFKIQAETDIFPFDEKYAASERLFFVWTLMSTFHDVGIPIEHLERVQRALNNFMVHFGLGIREFILELDASVGSRLEYYFGLVTRMFDLGIVPENGIYRKADKPNPFLFEALFRAYDQRNHGVISALALFRGIEETVLVKESDKPELNLDSNGAKRYINCVFEQDITRAALAVALHSLSPQNFPKFFPIRFSKLPLTFLLVLCDELQEFFRLEGISLKGVTKLKQFPSLTISVNNSPIQLRLKVDVCYQELEPHEEKEVLKNAQAYVREKGEFAPENYKEVVSMVYEEIRERLDSKLLIDHDEPIKTELNVFWQSKKGDISLISSWMRPTKSVKGKKG